jgi:hypothetical protein
VVYGLDRASAPEHARLPRNAFRLRMVSRARPRPPSSRG